MSILIKDKIAIVTDCNPFESTPELKLAEELVRQLKEVGHDSYVVKIPVDWHNGDTLMQSILSVRLLKIMNADAVIAINFPAAIVQHHNKYAWLTNSVEETARLRYSGVLSMADASESEAAHLAPHRLQIIKDLLIKIELSYLPECKRTIFCQNALQKNNVESDDENTGDFSSLTNLLKNTLTKLKGDSESENSPKLDKLIVSGFEQDAAKTNDYLSSLPWEQITRYFTRSLEIE